MESLIRFTLVVAAALYLGWGLALILAPQVTHAVISGGPFDPVTTTLFGAGLIGMTIVFVIAAYDPEREIVRASAAALAVVALAALYLMFLPGGMPWSAVTGFSLLVNLGAAFVLAVNAVRVDLRAQRRERRSVAPPRHRHA